MRIHLLICLTLLLVDLHASAAPPHPDLLFRSDPATGRMMLREGIRLEDYLPVDGVRATASLQADGVEYVLVLRVDFADQPGQRTRSQTDAYFFDPNRVSLTSYYAENSYGQMRIESGPLGGSLPKGQNTWYRMPKPMSYYGEGTYNLSRYRELVGAACELADADVDFRQYDRDNDGVLDHLVVLHSGNDQASTLEFADIWSLLVNSIGRAFDGVRVDTAVLVAEEPNFDSPHLGIYFHEFFHDLGAPDMYGSNSIADEQDNRWGLMSMFGPYQGEDNNGLAPSHICGYLKWDFDGDPDNGRHGWIAPVVIKGNRVLEVPSFETGSPADKLFRIDLPGKNGREFFLLENRNRLSGGLFDTGLPESGILIWHVDESLYRSPVDVASRLWVEDPSDPLHEFAYKNVDQLTAGAAYSLDDGQTAFTPSTEPNTNANDGTPTEISIIEIGPESDRMSLRVFFGDTYEPNDQLTEAFMIQPGPSYESFIYSQGDTDYYRFAVQTGMPVMITLSSLPETANYSLRLLDQAGRTLLESTAGGQAERELVYRPDYNGWAYVLVESAYGYSTTDSYELSITDFSPQTGMLVIEQVSVYPNPLRNRTKGCTFDFTLQDNRFADRASLSVYTVEGELVHEQTASEIAGGGHFIWMAVDSQGEPVASGIYAYLLVIENAQGSVQHRGLVAIE